MKLWFVLAAACLAQDPAETHNRAGLEHLQKNRFVDAAREFRQAVEAQPKFVRAWTNLGSALAQAGEVEEAIGAFRKAVALDPADPQLHMNLGLVLRGKGDAAGALAEFRIVLASLPDNAEARLQLALTLKQQGDLAAAARGFGAVLDVDPERREAYYNLATVLRQQAAAARRGHPAAAPDTAVREAREALARGDRAAARAVLERAAPSAEVLNLLGFVQGQDRDLPTAIATLKRAVELKPELPEARYNLGVALWYHGERAGALESLEESARLNPAAAEVHAFLGMARHERGPLYRAIALDPNLPAPYLDHALLLLEAGRVPHAIGQIEAMLNLPGPAPDLNPLIAELRRAAADTPEVHNLLGLLLGKQGADPRQVSAEFREALRLRPGFAEAHNNLGLVLVQTGDHEGAVAEFRRAPEHIGAMANLGAALVAAEPAEAIRLLEKVVALQPAYVRAHYNLALAYAQVPERSEQAMAQFREVLDLEPAFAAAHFEFGKLLFRKNAVTDAIAQFQEAIRLDANLGAARYQLGLALTRAGHRAEGAAELEKARAAIEQERKLETPDTFGVFEEYIRRQQYLELEPLVREYLKSNSNSWRAHYILGYALFGQHRIGDSIAALARSLELNIKNADAHRLLGRDLMVIGRFDAAQTELEQAVKLRPEWAEAHFDLGKTYAAHDNYPPARRELEEAIRLDASYMEAYDSLGFVMEALGQNEAALANYRRAAELSELRNAGFAAPYINLAAYFNRAGDTKLALEYARKALQSNPKSDGGNFQLAKALERNQDFAGAAEALNLAIQANPNMSSYHYVLSGIYRRLGRAKESQEQMDTFRKLEKEAANLEQRRRGMR